MALIVTDVTKKYGEKIAVNNISFEHSKPGIFGLLGTNGAGKTTTIRMILGITSKDSGQISWNGDSVSRELYKFGYLPEERGVYQKIKVLEQLIYFAKLRGINTTDAKTRALYWLERLNITEYKDHKAEQLSKGNQQKVQFITALIHNPEIIILDEPFSGLDPVNTDLFRDVILELLDKNIKIIMSSHQMHTVEEYCDNILILKNGNTILNGSLREIKSSYGRNNLIIKSPQDITKLAVDAKLTDKNTKNGTYEYKITSEEQGYNFLKELINKNITIDKFEIREPSLHEIFVEKVGA